MEKARRILIAARQAGTANAFTPLIHYLRTIKGVEMALVAYPHAAQAWHDAGLDNILIINSYTEFPAAHFLKTDLLLTGTSASNPEDDARWWHEANLHGVHSIAFVDQWINIAPRFAKGLPDCIAVIDEAALQASRNENLAAEALSKIVITSSPAFDALIPDPNAANAIRKRHKIAADDTLCLLVYEPLLIEIDDHLARQKFGYCESDIWNAILPALAKSGEKIVIAQRLHPIQKDASVPVMLKDIPNLLATGDRLLWAQAADIVIGIHSMLLLESAYLGTPVVAYQPHRLNPSALTDRRKGIQVIDKPEQLLPALQKALKKSKTPPASGPAYGHSQLFCSVLGIVNDSTYSNHC